MDQRSTSRSASPHSAGDLSLLRQRFIEGAAREPEWPDLESLDSGDPNQVLEALAQTGQAYIHSLKALLEETRGYLPDELASRIAERCAFTDVLWLRDVHRVQALLECSAATDAEVSWFLPTLLTPRKRKSPPHRPAESEGWPEDDPLFYRYLSRLVGLPLDRRSDVAFREKTGLPKDKYYSIVVAINAKAAPQLGTWAELKDPHVEDRLSAAGSARVLRVARVFVRAVLLFGTRPPAAKWMLQPQPWMNSDGEESPLALCARSEEGTRQVEQRLARVSWGIF
ncbi:antitoxin Xre/MbcA/ParS toxin-binding domain-containing protein [Ottowia testudinis]|uniref:DUF2384 domain-containing protein n=1 Tax=Ottowia testudinis TaxID=2816950 RepID=A0A975CIS7_9BURK|nr:antitoxin Xre/MbcA/ParS toxin-binding domain-containing protein [Ottowia testudinis]QTD46527.1 DUF2384 domain-containing protein [Ottowia testudinis]